MAPIDGSLGLDQLRDRNRAQLILIGALALAVSLVVIALVLNSAIYTHNLASRADSPGEDTINYAADVRENAGGMADYANRNFDSYGTILSEYQAGLGYIGDRMAGEAATGGRITSVEHVTGSDVEGVRVVDDVAGGSAFYPETGTPDQWNVTTETRVRSFYIDVEGGLVLEPKSTVNSTVKDIDSGIVPSGAFVVELDDGTTTRYVAVFLNDSLPTAPPTAMVHDGGKILGTCSVDSGSLPARVDFTDSTFGGEFCPALSFVDDLFGTYSVKYYNGGSISGGYELIADLPIDSSSGEVGPFTDSVDTLNYDAHCNGPTYNDAGGSYPRVEPGVYATDVRTIYQTGDVTYQSVQRTAKDEPGPPPQTPRINSFNVDETDGDSDDGEFDITWTASDPNGDSIDTTVRVTEPDGDVKTFSNPGSSTASIDADDESGVYRIELIVDDGTDDTTVDGNSRSVVEVHDDDGDESGCPP